MEESLTFHFLQKDTITADENHDEVNRGQHAWGPDAAVGFDTFVHNNVPVFTCKYLECKFKLNK